MQLILKISKETSLIVKKIKCTDAHKLRMVSVMNTDVTIEKTKDALESWNRKLCKDFGTFSFKNVINLRAAV